MEKVPKNKPLLFLCNHQNALLDALLIATQYGRFSYFLTRAGVFKKSFVSKLLHSFQMLPVYRVRDGWNTITNNNSIFNTCSELLNNGESVVIFPEGGHNLMRSVRPLSKGFTRIVFNTLEKYPNADLQLVPIGLNFEKAERFPDSVSIYFGEPLNAKDFISDNRNDDVRHMKANVQLEISKLTTDIPLFNYNEDLKALENLNINFLNPKEVNACMANKFMGCVSKPKPHIHWLRLLFKGLLILNIFLPYFVWKSTVQPKINEIEFISTFRFAIAVTLVPFYLLIIVFVITLMFSFKIALMYLLFVLILALLTTKL